jgi:hypothetical protein
MVRHRSAQFIGWQKFELDVGSAQRVFLAAPVALDCVGKFTHVLSFEDGPAGFRTRPERDRQKGPRNHEFNEQIVQDINRRFQLFLKHIVIDQGVWVTPQNLTDHGFKSRD